MVRSVSGKDFSVCCYGYRWNVTYMEYSSNSFRDPVATGVCMYVCLFVCLCVTVCVCM